MTELQGWMILITLSTIGFDAESARDNNTWRGAVALLGYLFFLIIGFIGVIGALFG